MERARNEIEIVAPPSDDEEPDNASRRQALPCRLARLDCGAGAGSEGETLDEDDEPPGRAPWQLPSSDNAPAGAVPLVADHRDRRLRVLLARQAREGPRILVELRTYREKLGCWIWWIYPTAKEGLCEPRPRTAVTAGDAPLLLERAPPVWREVLEEIGALVVAKRMRLDDVLPTMDHGRVRAFIPFWRGVLEAHPCDWMRQHLDILDEAFYKKRGKPESEKRGAGKKRGKLGKRGAGSSLR